MSFDFLAEIGSARMYTFHSHTEFCDGRAQMEAFAREAVRRGFTHYGFSPHSPIPFPSPCNMHPDKVPAYLSEVERIRSEYGDRCRFYAGMEIDFLGDEWGPASEYFKNLPLDYRIGSVHFIRSQEGEWVDIDGRYESFRRKMVMFHNDLDYVVEEFFRQSHAMIDAGGLDMIGHFDKVAHNASHHRPGLEDTPTYRRLLDELIDHIIDSELTVEINTKAYADHRQRLFPSLYAIKRLKQADVPMLVNSDAHVPALIDASRHTAFELLDSL